MAPTCTSYSTPVRNPLDPLLQRCLQGDRFNRFTTDASCTDTSRFEAHLVCCKPKLERSSFIIQYQLQMFQRASSNPQNRTVWFGRHFVRLFPIHIKSKTFRADLVLHQWHRIRARIAEDMVVWRAGTWVAESQRGPNRYERLLCMILLYRDHDKTQTWYRVSVWRSTKYKHIQRAVYATFEFLPIFSQPVCTCRMPLFHSSAAGMSCLRRCDTCDEFTMKFHLRRPRLWHVVTWVKTDS